jgi:hypothetical protein
MKSLLLENRIGCQYPNINKISKSMKELFMDDNCCLVSTKANEEFFLIFPLKFDCLSNTKRPQRGNFISYEYIIKLFIRKKIKKFNFMCNKVSIMESKIFFKGSKNVYIACSLVNDSFFKNKIKFKLDDFFSFFSKNFNENIKELETHILDDNPYRYKYIF